MMSHMMSHMMSQPSSGTRALRTLRGNTIVLVTAILVLLVIIATAFVGRTRAVRDISAAQQSAAGRDGRAESIGVDVASEIAGALFAKPVDTNDPFARVDNSVSPSVVVASASWPRLAPPLDAERYSIDRDVLPFAGGTNIFNGDGYPDFGYNSAPYETKAWTNWPDFFGPNSPWPFGPGSPQGATLNALNRPIGDANPYGSPGMGDSRWLRSTEPERAARDDNGDGSPDYFNFTHWSHLSWLPTANNGWRVVADISNINTGTVDNLNEAAAGPYAVAMPYEQWLPGIIPNGVANGAQFITRRDAWFFDYPNQFKTANALPNFFELKALGKPTDEFKPGTDRNVVSRTFTDTDGDGFTDSYWFLAPVSVDRGVRTIVGVSIVDNSALLNANVATKFSFDTSTGQTPSDLALVTSVGESNGGSTVGFLDGPINQPAQAPFAATPSADLPSPMPTWWTGNPATDLVFSGGVPRFDRSRFGDRDFDGNGQIDVPPLGFLQAIGARSANGGIDSGAPSYGYPLADANLPVQPPAPGDPVRGTFESARERLAYFKISGLDPEKPLFGLTPFDAADEFELRAYHGNNLPFTLSRFEQALSLYSPLYQGNAANDFQFLRASPMREEADEYLDQLSSRQLLVDNRRKLTLFNGARNETAPPWLWQTPYYEETVNYMNPRGNVPPAADPAFGAFQAANRAEFERQKLKVDLRAPMFLNASGQPALLRNAYAASLWRRDLARLLERSLAKVTVDAGGSTTYQTIYGTREADYQRTLSMIASYVANLDCASDEAQTLGTSGIAIDRPLYPTPIQQDAQQYSAAFTDAMPDPFNQNQFYLGMEKQPFIMEVFYGLAYPKSNFTELEWTSQGGSPPPPNQEELPPDIDDGGENFVDSTSKPRAVIAVQIANPYDTPISLGDFRLQCFGQTFSFAAASIAAGPVNGYGPNPVLPPATLGKPSTAIVFAVDGGAVGGYGVAGDFQKAVLDFLDIERGETTSGASVQQSDLDADGLIEYVGLYDARGNLTSNPKADPSDRTIVLNASAQWKVILDAPGDPGAINTPYTSTTQQPVQLLRNITPPAGLSGAPLSIVVDRFDNAADGGQGKFNEGIQRLFTDPQHIPPKKSYVYDPANPSRRYVAGVRIKTNDFFMTWCRASRIWTFDVDTWNDSTITPDQKRITATELSPRYVFSMATTPVRSTRQWDGVDENGAPRENNAGYKGDCWQIGQDPDGDATGAGRWASMVWVDMFGRTLRSKPVFFTNLTVIPAGGTEVITSSNGTDPMPFLPNLIPNNSQTVRGYQALNGTNYEWMIGNKGCSAADWAEFDRSLTMKVPFQMTQKDSDFDQVGEILDVFLWGHVFQNWTNPTTVRTFSEIMVEEDEDDLFYPGEGLYTNRLWTRLPGELGTDDLGSIVLGARFDPASTTPIPEPLAGYIPWQPALPAGVAMLDGLTLDGPGRNSFDRNGNSAYDPVSTVPGAPLSDTALTEERQFRLAHGFLGRKTPGLININTALPEVMQAMPMLTRLARANGKTPYSHVVDAIRSYRDRGAAAAPTPALPAPYYTPNYGDRGFLTPQFTGPLTLAFPADQELFFPGIRGERGFASIGELTLLARTPPAGPLQGTRNSYSMRWLGLDPYEDFGGGDFDGYPTGYSWSTDRTNSRPRQLPADIFTAITPPADVDVPFKQHDEPLGDVEDMNLLFKGISNLVTTRSDVFTVYLRIRQVKQNPVTQVWDGTASDQIVDDSRYVLCVDRSEVNSPSDPPKILYFQKCPN